MRRRDFIALVGGAVLLPAGARAQQIKRRVGVLLAYQESDAAGRVWVKAFRDGLAQFGWTEGRNIQLDLRWATTDLNIIEQNAKALVGSNPEVILSSSTPTTAALKQQTHTIPVVFANVVDPVGSGFVASLSRPSGNVTGFVNLEASISGKWLGLLKEVAPHVARVAVLFHPPTAPYAHIYLDVFKSSADAFKVEIASVSVPDSGSLETLIASQAREANRSHSGAERFYGRPYEGNRRDGDAASVAVGLL
jgi:putative ABC transport system substrate-binding protein